MLKNYIKVRVDRDGDKYYLNGKRKGIHRLDGPAVERKNGDRVWYVNGNFHRNIDPTIISPIFETKSWLFNNKIHRIGYSATCQFFLPPRNYWHIAGKQYTKQEYFNIVWDI